MNQLRRAGAMGSVPHAPPLRRRYLRRVAFEYVACYKQRRPYFVYLCGGFDHGYKQQRTPLVVGIDNVYNPLRLKLQAILSRR